MKKKPFSFVKDSKEFEAWFKKDERSSMVTWASSIDGRIPCADQTPDTILIILGVFGPEFNDVDIVDEGETVDAVMAMAAAAAASAMATAVREGLLPPLFVTRVIKGSDDIDDDFISD